MIILDKEIPTYGICFFIGITLAILVALIFINKNKIDLFDFLACCAYLLIGAIVGAKLLFILINIETIIENNIGFFDIIKSGFVFYGGLFGGLLGVLIFGWQFKTNVKKLIDIFAVVLPLGHAIGRIGCFLGGCCYGIKYNGIFSHTYYHSDNIYTPLGVKLFPVQLLESFLLFILFILLIFVYTKRNNIAKISLIYLTSYSIMRFFLEFLRGDIERGSFLYLSTSQWISLFTLFIILIYNGRKFLKQKGEIYEK